MIKVGNPRLNNLKLKELILNKLNYINYDDFYNSLIYDVDKNSNGLDIGKGLRENHITIKNKSKKLQTLDINEFEDYPDIQMDLCEKSMDLTKFRFTRIYCFSILEHCYDPVQACLNMEKMLTPNGKIYGYVPFLFNFHCPEDLNYQDYFRFTSHSFVYLFPNAKRIYVQPVRGKVGTGLMIITSSYKYFFERRFYKLSKYINGIGLKNLPNQTSGYNFIIEY